MHNIPKTWHATSPSVLMARVSTTSPTAAAPSCADSPAPTPPTRSPAASPEEPAMTQPNGPRVVGLDLSITATGIAFADGTTHTIRSTKHGDERLLDIVYDIAKAVQHASLAVIEDLPTHAKSAGITGMVHGAVRMELLRSFVPYVLITPASLKKYASGKGNCGKPEMAVAAFKRLGIEPGDDNQVDAAWLRAAALDHLGHPLAQMPATHRAALDAVTWPEMPAPLVVPYQGGRHTDTHTINLLGQEAS
ncbi:hypothetical protein ACQP2C_32580 [Micromonospora zamorensis]|uniref:hypothetical protein n=1 Tax=Micromonospora zamorensis TaxID=709883 RepID=UPI003D963444